MEVQHFNVRLLLDQPERVELEPLIPIFHDWIRDQVCEELLLDIADYRHVPAGPGIVLIGHEANYSVDDTGNRLAVRYNRKAPLDGTNQDRLKQAAQAALEACQRLESDSRLNGSFRFNGREIEIFLNDRLLSPNNPRTREAVEPDLAAFLQKLWAGGEYSLSYNNSPRELFSVTASSVNAFSVAALLQNLDP